MIIRLVPYARQVTMQTSCDCPANQRDCKLKYGYVVVVFSVGANREITCFLGKN